MSELRNKEDIIEWAKEHGYNGDENGLGEYLDSIGMAPIFDKKENRFFMEPWNG